MKIKLFTILDHKAEAYLPPFQQPSTNMAIRLFSDSVCDETHAFNKHPEDYTLFEIGSFDDDSATITPHQTKIPLGNGLDFYQEPPGRFSQVQIDFVNQLMKEKAK